MLRSFLFVGVIFVALPVFGLQKHTNSTEYSFSTFLKEQDFNVKSEMALDLWEYYRRSVPDSLPILGKKVIEYSQAGHHAFGMAVARRIIGDHFLLNGKMDIAIGFFNISKSYFERREDYQHLTETLNLLGMAYFLKGDFITAESYYKASLRMGAFSPRETDAFLAEVNLAKLKVAQKDFRLAEALLQHYLRESIRLKKWEAAANASAVLMDVFLGQNKIQQANKYAKKQLKFAEKCTVLYWKIDALTNLAIIRFYEGDVTQSISLFKRVLNFRKQEKLPVKLFEAYFNLYGVYFENDNAKAELYLDTCLKIAQENQLLQSELEVTTILYTDFKRTSLKSTISILNDKIKRLEKSNEKEREGLIKLFSRKAAIQKPSLFSTRFWYLIPLILVATLLLLGRNLNESK